MTMNRSTVVNFGTIGQDRHQRLIDDDDAVLGMVDRVSDLLRKEPKVDRVQDGADGGDGEIGFEMLLAIPAKAADAVTGFDAEPMQRRRELMRTRSATWAKEDRRVETPSKVTTSL